MSVITVEFETDSEQEAHERVDKHDNGKVSDNGNYLRECKIPFSLYEAFLELVEADDEASIKGVKP